MRKEVYMRRAVELANRGIGAVNPNPLVGAVIVKDGRVIGEGWHRKYGDLHAERDAFAHLTEPADGAELYVTLEPCCHYGKQPPCVDAIIGHGIRKVFVGSDDPNPLVSGKGITKLRNAGIEVETHVLKDECDALNRVFFHYITEKTPYVVMKYAMTMDGKIAADSGKSKWVTGSEARAHVMEQRNAFAGIMVGVGTVVTDDPMLTCRMEGGRNPVRIICDSRLRIPMDSQIVRTAGEVPTVVATVRNDRPADGGVSYAERKAALTAAHVSVLETDSADGYVDLQALMHILGERRIDGVLLEGGGTLNMSAVRAGIVQEADIYIAPKIFGGSGNYTPVSGTGAADPADAWGFHLGDIRTFDNGDVLLRYYAHG